MQNKYTTAVQRPLLTTLLCKVATLELVTSEVMAEVELVVQGQNVLGPDLKTVS